MNYCETEDMLGKVFTEIKNNANEILLFCLEDGSYFKMWYKQDCCETVILDDIAGNLDDLLNSPITMAEVSTNSGTSEYVSEDYYDDSVTWTFYKLATIKG